MALFQKSFPSLYLEILVPCQRSRDSINFISYRQRKFSKIYKQNWRVIKKKKLALRNTVGREESFPKQNSIISY